MTDFVLNGQQTADYIKLYDGCFKYANFLKQKLQLWMFLPCKLVDGVWVVLEEPESLKGYYETDTEGMRQEAVLRKEYQEAKYRCIFNVTPEFVENNIYDENGFFYTLEIVEDLIVSHNNYNLELTQTAQKQIS